MVTMSPMYSSVLIVFMSSPELNRPEFSRAFSRFHVFRSPLPPRASPAGPTPPTMAAGMVPTSHELGRSRFDVLAHYGPTGLLPGRRWASQTPAGASLAAGSGGVGHATWAFSARAREFVRSNALMIRVKRRSGGSGGLTSTHDPAAPVPSGPRLGAQLGGHSEGDS